jgi:filamentous hemagglutinin family protein
LTNAAGYAQIKLDGSIGNAGNLDLQGPDYEIKPEYGKQAGTNLFHSFQKFNIHSGQSATFTGPDSVENIISRVTGGESSWIDGILRSTIPSADLYFLNPSGVMFGPNASLDLGGSFHLSTADYLRMGANERFYAMPFEGEVLSIAPPSAFGFLDSNVGPITFEGYGDITLNMSDLANPMNMLKALIVPKGETISIVGGDIEMKNGTTVTFGDILPLGPLFVDSGRINIASVASEGEVIPTESDIDTSSFKQLGKITISEHSAVNAGGGEIFIRGGEFFLFDTSYISCGQLRPGEYINWDNLQIPWKDVIIGGDGGIIDIQVDKLLLTNGSRIYSDTYKEGNAGSINIFASESVEMKGYNQEKNFPATITSRTRSTEPNSGDGGNVLIETKDILLADGGWIGTESFGGGNSGNVTIQTSGSIKFVGTDGRGWASKINTATYCEEDYAGKAGNISIEAHTLFFEDGGKIYSKAEGMGDGGSVEINASGAIDFTGVNPHGENPNGFGSGIYAETKMGGIAGDISIKADSLSITNGALISNSTSGNGNGGDTTINVKGNIRIAGDSSLIKIGTPLESQSYCGYEGECKKDLPRTSGIYSESESETSDSGEAGSIILTAKELCLSDKGRISTSTKGGGNANDIHLEVNQAQMLSGSSITSTSNSADQGGEAGRIIIGKHIEKDEYNEIKEIKPIDSIIMDNGTITTEAVDAGGGKVTISTQNMLYLKDSEIITKVHGGDGKGGDIEISRPEFVTLNHSNIKADAYEGSGGNIHIAADQFIQSSGSILDASSKLGIDGEIKIEAPDTDIAGGLTVLPSDLPDPSRWLKTRCQERTGEDVSRFILAGRDGIPTSPDDWHASPPPPFDADIGQTEPGQLLISGEGFYHKGDFESAIKIWEQTMPLLNAKDSVYLKTLLYLTNAYQSVGHYEKAKSAYEKLLSFKLTRQSLNKIKREGLSEEVIAGLESLEDTEYEKDRFSDVLEAAIGKNKTAQCELPVLKHAEKFLSEIYGQYFSSLFYSSLADTRLSEGKERDAWKFLEKAAQLPEDPFTFAIIFNNIGNFFAVKGNYDEALAKYEECRKQLELAEPSQYIRLKSKNLINTARAEFEKARKTRIYDSIDESLNNAISCIEHMPDSYDKSFDLISLGLLIQNIGKELGISEFRAVACQLLGKALHIGENLQNKRIMSYSYGYMGQLYEQEKRYSDAVKLTREALFMAQHHPELLYLWQWQLGRLLKDEGNIKDAVQAYKFAADILTPACENASGEECKKDETGDREKLQPAGVLYELFSAGYRRKHIFEEKAKPVFLGLAELLLEQAASEQNSRKKLLESIDIMELLKTAEIQDFYKNECLTIIPQKNRRISAHISPHTAMLYPIVFPEALTLLVNLPDSMIQKEVHVTAEELREVTKEIRKRSDIKSYKQYDPQGFMYFSKMLYNWLIRPIEQELIHQQINTLIIAPDMMLGLIPFPALFDENDNKFLIQKYALATVPAITLTDFGESEGKEGNTLLCGLSKDLPHVPEELKAIRTLTSGNCSILLDKEFTSDNLNTEFGREPYAVVVISTHGKFGGTPEDTFLEIYDGKLTMNDLERLVSISRFREQKTELLILSACETAIGDERVALGLGGIALKAGARSAIATLWSVADKAAFLVMKEFFRQLKSNPAISKAKALQNAQTAILNYPAYSHPAFWAPFLLIGNWL